MVKPTNEMKSVKDGKGYLSLNIKPSTRDRLLKHKGVLDTWDGAINKMLNQLEGATNETITS